MTQRTIAGVERIACVSSVRMVVQNPGHETTPRGAPVIAARDPDGTSPDVVSNNPVWGSFPWEQARSSTQGRISRMPGGGIRQHH